MIGQCELPVWAALSNQVPTALETVDSEYNIKEVDEKLGNLQEHISSK